MMHNSISKDFPGSFQIDDKAPNEGFFNLLGCGVMFVAFGVGVLVLAGAFWVLSKVFGWG